MEARLADEFLVVAVWRWWHGARSATSPRGVPCSVRRARSWHQSEPRERLRRARTWLVRLSRGGIRSSPRSKRRVQRVVRGVEASRSRRERFELVPCMRGSARVFRAPSASRTAIAVAPARRPLDAQLLARSLATRRQLSGTTRTAIGPLGAVAGSAFARRSSSTVAIEDELSDMADQYPSEALLPKAETQVR